jgi:hypothetical protein
MTIDTRVVEEGALLLQRLLKGTLSRDLQPPVFLSNNSIWALDPLVKAFLHMALYLQRYLTMKLFLFVFSSVNDTAYQGGRYISFWLDPDPHSKRTGAGSNLNLTFSHSGTADQWWAVSMTLLTFCLVVSLTLLIRLCKLCTKTFLEYGSGSSQNDTDLPPGQQCHWHRLHRKIDFIVKYLREYKAILQKGFNLWAKGPDGVVWWKNRRSKISWQGPFNSGRSFIVILLCFKGTVPQKSVWDYDLGC